VDRGPPLKAAAALTVGPAGRVEEMSGSAPVAFRPAGGQYWLVGTSASPVGDDDVTVRVTVRPGSAAVVRTNAATILWAGRGTRQEVLADVEAGGHLEWRPEPVVTTARCDHHQSASVELAVGATLLWREVLVLGRHGEDPGRLRSDLAVRLGGSPLFCHTLEIGSPGWSGPAVLGDHRAVAFALTAGAGRPSRAAGPQWCVSPLDGPGGYALALGATALAAEGRLAEAVALFPE
jgi:urease accessory protein